MTLAIERLEGKYEILDKLAEGGMGAVYKVRHVHLDEVRVIKVMRAALKGDKELEERFVREARLATKLRHPNIAQLFDFDLDGEGNAYIVLEFITGLTLDDLVDRHGPPPLGLALEIGRQSLRSIGYLHRRQFVHRDISPDNLMLSRDVDGRPLVKLIDLGIAKGLEAEGAGLTTTGSFLGKVRYTSPEQLESRELDGRSDLYAFGVVLYELLTGERPIVGDSPTALVAGHLLHPPRSFEETDPDGRVPAELREIVLQALEKKREDRIATAEAFSRRLGRLQSRFPLSDAEVEEVFDELPPEPAPEPPAPAVPPPAAPAPGKTRRLERPPPAAPAPRLTSAQAVRQVEDLIERRELDAAEKRLAAAVAELGPQETFDEIHRRIDELRRREAKLAPIARGIEGFLRLGELDKAAAALERSTTSWGETSEFAALRRRIVELKRQRAGEVAGEAAGDDVGRGDATRLSEVGGEPDPAPPQPAPAVEVEAPPAPEPEPPAVPAEAIPPEAVPREVVPPEAFPQEAAVPQEVIPQEVVPQEVVPQEVAPQEVVPQEAAPQEVIPRETVHGTYWKWALPAILILLLIDAGVDWLRQRGAASGEGAADPVAAEAAAEAPGFVTIDAPRWVRLVAIRDDRGTRHDLPRDRSTPLTVELPPGIYTIALENPRAGGRRTIQVAVRPGERVRATVEF